MNLTFNKDNYHSIIDGLTARDRHLARIVATYGYPPMWRRAPGFATLVLIILEQQVSLASAFAAFEQLRNKIGTITPAAVLALSDAELRACYFSRQKTVYVRELAMALLSGELDLDALPGLHEEEIRVKLKKIKGIGDWTVDVYLIFVLQHADHFPFGDVALVNSLKFEMEAGKSSETNPEKINANVSKDKDAQREELVKITDGWRPHRTIAAMLLWHAYIQRKKMKGPAWGDELAISTER